jgi:Tol biopolymer transport system component
VAAARLHRSHARPIVGFCLLAGVALAAPSQATVAGANGRIAFASDLTPSPVVTSGAPSSLETDVHTVRADGSGRTRLTLTASTDGIASWSPDGLRLAFVSTRDGNGEIYVMNWDGTGQTRLTNHPAVDTQPRWSPDGAQLVFVSSRTGNLELFLMNTDGSDVIQITEHPAADTWPEFSPDGATLAFTSDRNGSSAVYAANADGSDVHQLTADELNAGQADWSPDGSRIAFVNNFCGKCPPGRPLSDIFILRLASGEIRQVTHRFGNNLNPSWSPDGSKLAFWHAPASPATNNTDVYSVNVDGAALTNITATPTLREYVPDWGPNQS